jgi:signal transduction histidine kinase
VSDFPAATPPPASPSSAATLDLEHEWRTPMTVIQSAAEVLRGHDDLSDEERTLFLDALLEEAARLRVCLETVMAPTLLAAESR